MHKQVKKRCILDGELIVIKDGKPDFFEIQRRSILTNTSADKLPAFESTPKLYAHLLTIYLQGMITLCG